MDQIWTQKSAIHAVLICLSRLCLLLLFFLLYVTIGFLSCARIRNCRCTLRYPNPFTDFGPSECGTYFLLINQAKRRSENKQKKNKISYPAIMFPSSLDKSLFIKKQLCIFSRQLSMQFPVCFPDFVGYCLNHTFTEVVFHWLGNWFMKDTIN